MNTIGAPVKVIKAGEASPEAGKTEAATSPAKPSKKGEPEVQWAETEPGVFDITFTCSCGERTVIRCQSVETPQVKNAPEATSKSSPTLDPAKPEETPPVA